MASTITDDLSTLDSEQFDDLSVADRDRETTQDIELDAIDFSSPSSRKRCRQSNRPVLWSYARERKDHEPKANKHRHSIWYCGQATAKGKACSYNSSTHARIREHLKKTHNIQVLEEGEERPSKRQASLRESLLRQREHSLNAYTQAEQLILKKVMDVDNIKEKTIRLIAGRCLPLNLTTWPEITDWLSAFNPFARDCLPSRASIRETLIRINQRFISP